MPLPKRVVEPVHVSRNTIPEGYPLPSELEAATNGTLANIVRQLSSLSRHAEDTFGELVREAQGVSVRANNLQARIDRLAMKVTQLDSTVEEGTCSGDRKSPLAVGFYGSPRSRAGRGALLKLAGVRHAARAKKWSFSRVGRFFARTGSLNQRFESGVNIRAASAENWPVPLSRFCLSIRRPTVSRFASVREWGPLNLGTVGNAINFRSTEYFAASVTLTRARPVKRKIFA